MSYLIQVKFSCFGRPDIIFSDVIDPDDWSCANYWDDLGDAISALIGFSESKLSRKFPYGHDYQLSGVNCISLEVEE